MNSSILKLNNEQKNMLWVSAILSLVLLIILLFLHISLIRISIIVVIFFFISYFVCFKITDNYIQNKIKIIYKLIYKTKSTHLEDIYHHLLLPPKSIDEVTAEVKNWAENTNRELLNFETNTQFRKEFLQNISHEFKTPIFAIQSYIETLLEGTYKDQEICKTFLEKTFNNTKRILKLIEDLDIITQLESNQYNLIIEKIDIKTICKEVVDDCMILLKEKSINVVGIQDPEEIIVYGDKNKIYQVIRNIIENGIKYGKIKGQISINFNYIENDKTYIEITDNGIGIAEDHLSRVFERFYRTDLGRSRDIGGSGLGLAICKHIIESHNEIINIRSKPNIGTTIGFTLKNRQHK